MAFEQPELGMALRELAIERDSSFVSKRQTYVDYDANGRIERITWPDELGEAPEPAAINAKVQAVRQKLTVPPLEPAEVQRKF